ncbi:phosphatase 2C-like domain-containing protein [Terfezia claveryi]|nr:phosphatase 2C-like domain-containing protein [Terfezia claveryi]
MFGNNSSSTSSSLEKASAQQATPSSSTDTKPSRGSSGKASSLIASARSSLSSFGSSIGASANHKDEDKQPKSTKTETKATPTATPNHNNSAGDSRPGPNSTFRVGVTEDRNKKCRRTMEDTHSFLYNFLSSTRDNTTPSDESSTGFTTETDNGYFAIFDGHAGAYAADWCGKKLHLVLEETIRKNPHTPIPELLDVTFTNCDGQLEKLPMRNSGCTAVCAVLRWEDRPRTGTLTLPGNDNARVLYTANVGDARIVLCRGGKALRLSYDHKGSDENESRRVSNAGGLILNNRVNGVLAVTRALGDSYMKELVTGHPYTTETVLQDDDDFIVLACDGLWDVCSDQDAVDLVRHVDDPQEASKILVDHALQRFSSDNLSCMIVRLDHVKMRATEAAKRTAKSEVPAPSGEPRTEKKTESETNVEGAAEK